MKRGEFDYWLFFTVIGLVVFGLVMIASVSVYESYNTFGVNDFYFWRRIAHMGVAFAAFVFCLYMPYRFWEKFSLVWMICAIGLLGLVLTGAGADYGTARSWVVVSGFSVQPVEVAKLALIIYFAHWMSEHRSEIKDFKFGFLPFVGILSAVVILVALQPDFGSIVVITLTAVAVFLVAGGSLLQVFGGGIIAGLLAMYVVMSTEYIRNRFVTFFNPELDELGIGYQIQNALTAIGSGGWFGVGFGQSIQKNGYLPEVQADAIFAAIGEEMGFFRTLLLLCLFGFIAYRGYSIARESEDWFAKLVVVGVISSVVIQASINMMVNLAIFPNTGITLPFISYGGSSLLITMMGMGMVLNISKGSSAPSRSSRQRSLVSRVGRSSRFSRVRR
jgi:cell division protein FtsW